MNTRGKDFYLEIKEDYFLIKIYNKKDNKLLKDCIFGKSDKLFTIDDLHYDLQISFKIAKIIWRELKKWLEQKEKGSKENE